MIITFGGIKGGVGKTTLATNLTYIRAVIAKKKVLFVDADDHQWSASDWVEHREARGIETPWTTIRLSEKAVRNQILKLKNNYDDIIIDTGGRDSQSLRAALTISDVLLSPFQPKTFDVWTINKLTFLIEEMILANPNLKTYTVVNRGDSKGKDNEDAKEILSESIKCLPAIIYQRKAISNASANGKSVFESEKNIDKKAVEELMQLHNLIFNA